mmetsp:Transcript_68698/g.217284  ORF Transcript_68698/g.217284 Transcript_68698/m.217284 type:complete len:251 (-) Transcript_68698:535-1287(-)
MLQQGEGLGSKEAPLLNSGRPRHARRRRHARKEPSDLQRDSQRRLLRCRRRRGRGGCPRGRLARAVPAPGGTFGRPWGGRVRCLVHRGRGRGPRPDHLLDVVVLRCMPPGRHILRCRRRRGRGEEESLEHVQSRQPHTPPDHVRSPRPRQHLGLGRVQEQLQPPASEERPTHPRGLGRGRSGRGIAPRARPPTAEPRVHGHEHPLDRLQLIEEVAGRRPCDEGAEPLDIARLQQPPGRHGHLGPCGEAVE